MGGRGASNGGRSGRAPRGYRTIGKAHRIPIIKSHLPKGANIANFCHKTSKNLKSAEPEPVSEQTFTKRNMSTANRISSHL